MGRKRITAVIEVTYEGDDPRSMDDLKRSVLESIRHGIDPDGGTLVAFAVTNASVDPDPEPVVG